MQRTGSHAASPNGGQLLTNPFERLAHAAATRSIDTRVWDRLRLFIDVVVVYMASSAAVLGDATVRNQPTTDWIAATFPLVVVAMMHARRSPDTRLNGSLLDTTVHVLGVVSLATMLTIGVGSLFGAHSLQLVLRLWLFTAVYLGVARAVLLSIRRSAMRSGARAIPTLVVGAGTVGTQLVRRLAGDPSYGLRPVGFLDSDPLERTNSTDPVTVPILGGPEDLATAIENTGARRVILAFSSEPDHLLVAKARECQALGIDVSLVPRLYESINERATLDHVGGLPLLTLRAVDPRGWQFAVKHAIDRGFALVGLIVLSPLLMAIALAVRLSSPGSVLFRQERVGRDGQEFTMLKFRTMVGHPSAEGEADAGWAAQIRDSPEADVFPLSTPVPEEDRTTGVGRFLRDYSLDELPQLFNVLRGDMSLVGPRPERVAYVRDFERSVDRYADRHRVKSGLTGWAQVNGLRGETSIADRVEWDNYYIQNWSLRLDLRVMALTAAAVFKSSAGH
jgi:exopolysaccharide biosynthesis polyprenyl glycosylphosphotransferase